MEMKERESMNDKFELIRHFACQIIKESFDRNLVNVNHYHAKIDKVLNELYAKIKEG